MATLSCVGQKFAQVMRVSGSLSTSQLVKPSSSNLGISVVALWVRPRSVSQACRYFRFCFVAAFLEGGAGIGPYKRLLVATMVDV